MLVPTIDLDTSNNKPETTADSTGAVPMLLDAGQFWPAAPIPIAGRRNCICRREKPDELTYCRQPVMNVANQPATPCLRSRKACGSDPTDWTPDAPAHGGWRRWCNSALTTLPIPRCWIALADKIAAGLPKYNGSGFGAHYLSAKCIRC